MSRTLPLLPKGYIPLRGDSMEVNFDSHAETDASYPSDEWEDLELTDSFSDLTMDEGFKENKPASNHEVDFPLLRDKVLEPDPTRLDERTQAELISGVDNESSGVASTQEGVFLADSDLEREKGNVCATNDAHKMKEGSLKRKRSISGEPEFEEKLILYVDVALQKEQNHETESTLQLNTPIHEAVTLAGHSTIKEQKGMNIGATDVILVRDASLKRKISLSDQSSENQENTETLIEGSQPCKKKRTLHIELIPDVGCTVEVDATPGTVDITSSLTESSLTEEKPCKRKNYRRLRKRRRSYASESDVVVEKDPNKIPRAFLPKIVKKDESFKQLVEELRDKTQLQELLRRSEELVSCCKMKYPQNEKCVQKNSDMPSNGFSDKKLDDDDSEKEERDIEEEDDLDDEEHSDIGDYLDEEEESAQEVISAKKTSVTKSDAVDASDSSEEKALSSSRRKRYMSKTRRFRLYSRRERIIRKQFRRKYIWRNKSRKKRVKKNKKTKREQQHRIIFTQFSSRENPWHEKVMSWLSTLNSKR